MTVTFLAGDVHEQLATLPDSSVDLVLTSPPFWRLRSYLDPGHPQKGKELGQEDAPGEYIDNILDVVEALDRVLTPHGSICVELGDTRSNSGGAGGDYDTQGWREGQNRFQGSGSAHGNLLPEVTSMCLIPELFRVALSYGVNPLTGRQTPRWRLRNVVRWYRTNPSVGELTDRYRDATSDLLIATKAKARWFDLDAVRHQNDRIAEVHRTTARHRAGSRGGERETNDVRRQNLAGAPPHDTWTIPTTGYAGAHFAVWPEKLCEVPIKSMCPPQVCVECGTPRRRVTRNLNEDTGTRNPWNGSAGEHGYGDRPKTHASETVGWTDCGCGADWRPGVVLDPFAGSGTTLAVATKLGRDAIGIDLDEANIMLARERVNAAGAVLATVDGVEHVGPSGVQLGLLTEGAA